MLYTLLSRQAEPTRIARAARLVALDRVVYVRREKWGFVGVVRGDSGDVHVVRISEDGSRYSCTCMDYASKGKPCKHILAVAFYIERILSRNLHHHDIRESRVHHSSRAYHAV